MRLGPGQAARRPAARARASGRWRAAAAPSRAATAWFGASGASGLLVFSQVVLSLQLPFALVPLLLFTTRRCNLGVHAFGRAATLALWAAAALVICLNVWLLARLVS